MTLGEYLAKADAASDRSSLPFASRDDIEDQPGDSMFIYIESPVAADAFPIRAFSRAFVITKVYYQLQGSATPTIGFNLERRSSSAPYTSGSDVFGAELAADGTAKTATPVQPGAQITEGQQLWYAASSKGGTVDKIEVAIEGVYGI